MDTVVNKTSVFVSDTLPKIEPVMSICVVSQDLRLGLANGAGVGSIKSSNTKDDDGVDYSTIVEQGEDALPKAHGFESFAFGKKSKALGKRCFAFGNGAIADGNTSAAFGVNVKVNGNQSFGCGNQNIVSSDYSFAAGYGNAVSGFNSVAFGTDNKVTGSYASVFGYGNKANSNYSTVVGKYSEEGDGTELFVVANGTHHTAPSNAVVVKEDGILRANKGLSVKETLEAIKIKVGSAATVGANYSIVIGNNSKTTASSSAAVGWALLTSVEGQLVCGNGNKQNDVALFIVGNYSGTSSSPVINDRAKYGSNAFEVLKDGSVKGGRSTRDSDDAYTLVTKDYLEAKLAELR